MLFQYVCSCILVITVACAHTLLLSESKPSQERSGLARFAAGEGDDIEMRIIAPDAPAAEGGRKAADVLPSRPRIARFIASEEDDGEVRVVTPHSLAEGGATASSVSIGERAESDAPKDDAAQTLDLDGIAIDLGPSDGASADQGSADPAK